MIGIVWGRRWKGGTHLFTSQVVAIVDVCLSFVMQNIKKATTKHLHQILPNIHQTFVKVLPHRKSGWLHMQCVLCLSSMAMTFVADMTEALLQLLRERPNCYTIVFCNSVPCCDWAGRYLDQNGIAHVRLHGGFDAKVHVKFLFGYLSTHRCVRNNRKTMTITIRRFCD